MANRRSKATTTCPNQGIVFETLSKKFDYILSTASYIPYYSTAMNFSQFLKPNKDDKIRNKKQFDVTGPYRAQVPFRVAILGLLQVKSRFFGYCQSAFNNTCRRV